MPHYWERIEAGYRECIRAKKSLVVIRLGSNGHSQLVMLLLLGGDIEVNPGDKQKFSCGICSKPVRKNQARIQCDQCSNWFHVNANCCEISPAIFSILENSSCTWICPQCGLPSLSDSFFDSSMNSFNSSNYFEPLAASLESPAPSQFHPQDKSKGKPARRGQLKCLVVNCRSVKNKIADITAVINEYKPDIVFGNESWLKPDIKNSEIFPDNYRIYRKDRDNNGRGGGVFQAVKNDLIITHHSDWDSGCEIVWSQCQLAGR